MNKTYVRSWGESNRELRERMMAEDPHCYWCKIEVKHYEQVEGVRTPDDDATIDHVRSRFSRRPGEESEKVLACQKCNLRRADDEVRALKKKGIDYKTPREERGILI